MRKKVIRKRLIKKIDDWTEGGYTLNSLARMSGVPQPCLWNFQNGKDIYLDTAEKLLEFFAKNKPGKRTVAG